MLVEREVDVIATDRGTTQSSGARRILKAGILRVAKSGFSVADLGSDRWPGPRVLIYHQVGSGMRGQMDVPPSRFRRQVEWWTERGRFIRLEDLFAESASDASDRLAVITFDDGYEDVYRNAFPFLAERGIPFTLYLTTSYIENQARYENGASPLTWSQVGEMIGTGLATVGAHTHTHPDLRGLSQGEVAEELDRSNSLIAERTGADPRHFCYPKGYWSAGAETEVMTRYDTATLGPGAPLTPRTNPFRIPRVAVQRSDGMTFFKRKMTTGLRLEETARRAIKRYDVPSMESEVVEA